MYKSCIIWIHPQKNQKMPVTGDALVSRKEFVDENYKVIEDLLIDWENSHSMGRQFKKTVIDRRCQSSDLEKNSVSIKYEVNQSRNLNLDLPNDLIGLDRSRTNQFSSFIINGVRSGCALIGLFMAAPPVAIQGMRLDHVQTFLTLFYMYFSPKMPSKQLK